VNRLADIRHFALDLDGTLYLGGKLFPWTIPFLRALKDLGIGRTFFTNNSSKSTRQYVQGLNQIGIDATHDEIYSSTTSTLEHLRHHYPHAKRLFILGTPGLQDEFAEHGYTATADSEHDEPDAVIVAFDTTLEYPRLCRAAWWLSKGKPFIATHPDKTCPTDQPTVLPDCAALCAALTTATGRYPDLVLGKPHPSMLQGVRRKTNLAPHQIAVVGDRLYTDMAMAHHAGAVSVLVLSGESTRESVADAAPKPDYILENVGALIPLLHPKPILAEVTQ
jgi:HAD superfamily hydrolase (TIGR01450 family)